MGFTEEQIAEICVHHADGVKQVRLARTYGVTTQIIRRIIHAAGYISSHRERWSEQSRQAHRQLKIEHRNAGHNTKLTLEKVLDIKNRLARGEYGKHLAQIYGVSEGAISLIRKGKRWADVQAR